MTRLGVVLVSLLCAGCASLHSTPLTNDQPTEGLVYHLPRRDVVVTVTVDDEGGIAGLTAAAGPAYADVSHAYVLGFERSAFATHEIDITVSVDGLLTKSDATYSASLAAALEAVTESVGSLRASGLRGKTCSGRPGSHVFVLPVSPRQDGDNAPFDQRTAICGGEMTVQVQEHMVDRSAPAACQGASCWGSGTRVGVFYRQSRPYTVTVTPKTAGLNLTQTVLLPTRSPTRFLPMSRALFADASAKVGFEGGEPVTLVQTAEGEGSELIKLPAKLLQAYFAAVGAVFTGRAGRDTRAAEAAAAEARLQTVKQQMALCRAAASAQPADPAVVQAACAIDGP